MCRCQLGCCARKVHGWGEGPRAMSAPGALDVSGWKDKAKEYPDACRAASSSASRLPALATNLELLPAGRDHGLRWTRKGSSARSWTSCAKSRLRDRPFHGRRTRSFCFTGADRVVFLRGQGSLSRPAGAGSTNASRPPGISLARILRTPEQHGRHSRAPLRTRAMLRPRPRPNMLDVSPVRIYLYR